MLEPSMHLWNEPHLISAVLNAIFLIYCSVSFAGNCIIIHQRYGSVIVSDADCSSQVLGIRLCCSSQFWKS